MQSAPTRSNLLILRDRLAHARAGHSLLEHKREALAHELSILLQDAAATEAEAEKRFDAAYKSLYEARMRMGSDRLQWASLAPAAEVRTETTVHSVMGVATPLVQVEVEPRPLPYSLGDTSAALDDARTRWLDVAELIARLAETTTAVWRLAAELQKTQRRVNALEQAVIPQLEAQLHSIAESIEEQEREAFARAKRIKLRRQARDGDS